MLLERTTQLIDLWEKTEMSVDEIADKLKMNKQTLTRRVVLLRSKGLISKSRAIRTTLDDAEVLRLWNVEQLNARQIAEQLGVVTSLVKRRLYVMRDQGVSVQSRDHSSSFDDQLIEMWNSTGLTAREIADRLGFASASSVVGHVHRLRKAGVRMSSRGNESRKTFNIGPSAVHRGAMMAASSAVNALADNQCRWPNGKPEDDDFHFCPSTQREGSSYCEHHHQRSLPPNLRSPS